MYNLRMSSRIERCRPLHSTAIGKVLLAWHAHEVFHSRRFVSLKNDFMSTLKCCMAQHELFQSRWAITTILSNKKSQFMHTELRFFLIILPA